MASRIAGITVEIGGDTTKLSSALKSVNSEIKSTQTQLKDVEKLLKLDPTNTELLTQKQKDLTKAIADTKEKLNTLQTAAEQANEQLQNGEITQEQYDALQREILSTEQELQRLADEAAESNAALKKIDEVGEAFENVGGKISDVGKKLTETVTTTVAGLGTLAVTTTASFEESMSKVEALISSSSDDIEGDLDRLETKAREAGSTTKFSATEAADAMSYMGLAGWDADQMIDGLDGILNLAAASEMDLASASDIVTDYLSAFGMEASQSGELVDIMTYAMSNSNTSTAQLGEAYKNCASTAAQLGWDVDDVTAALMVMADSGSKGGEAGTALNSIMTRLANNTSNCSSLLEEYGIEVYDTSGNLNDLGDILTGMQGIWGDLNDEEKANLAYKVAGKTAESELMAVLGDSTGSLEAYTEGLNSCDGAAEDMANIMQDNLSGQLTILKSQLQELAISFGEILMPAVKSVISWIQSLVEKLNGMDEETKENITKIAALAAAVGPLLVVIGTLISKLGSAMQGFSDLGTSILKVIGHMETGTGKAGKLVTAISSISAPVAAAVAAIGTLAAAFVTLWSTNDEFRESIIGVWNEIKEKVCGFVDGIKERFEALGMELPSLGEIVETLKNIWIEFCDLLAPLFEGAFSAVSDILGTVLDALTGILDVFIGLFTGNWSQLWEGVKEIFSGIWDGIVGIFTSVTDTIKGIADVVLGWFGTTWEEVWGKIQTFFEDVWNGISEFFSGILETIQGVFDTVWGAVSDTVTTVMTAIHDTITNVWNTIYGILEPLLTSLQYLFETVWQAVQLVITTVMTTVHDIITGVWNTIVGFLSPILETIKNLVSKAWNAVSSTISSVMSAVSSKISSVWNSIKSTISSVLDKISSNVSSIWENIKKAVSDKVGGILTEVKNGFNKVVSFITGLVSDAKNWGKDMIQNIIDGITSKIQGVADAVTNVADKIRSFLHFSVPDQGPLSDADTWGADMMNTFASGVSGSSSAVTNAVNGVVSQVSAQMNSMMTNLTTSFTSGWNSVTSTVTAAVNKISTSVSTGLSQMSTAVTSGMKNVKSAMSSGWSSVKTVTKDSWSSIKTTVSNALTSMKSTITSKMSSIKSSMTSTFSSLVSSAYSWGKDICTQMSKGISASSGSVISQAKSLAQSVKNIIGFSLPKEGPLSDADEYMPDFMALLAEGIRTNMGEVVDGIETMAGSFRDTVEDGLDLSSLSVPNLAESVSAGSGSTVTNNSRTVNLGGIQVVVNGYNAQNDNELAQMVADKINEMLNEESAVFR